MNKLTYQIFQSSIVAFLPEFFFSFCLLLVLLYGSFYVVKATRLYTYIIPSTSRLTLVSLVLCLILACNNPVFNQVLWGGVFLTDCLSVYLKPFVIIIMFFCVIVSEDYLFIAKIRTYEIFVFFIGICLSLCLLISAYDILSVYLSIEFLSLILYTLAALKKDSGFSAEASLKYFILGSLASVFLLLGASLIYFTVGSTNLGCLTLLLENINLLENEYRKGVGELKYYTFYGRLSKHHFVWLKFTPSIILYSGLVLLGSSLLFKLGAAPYHLWVADVYEGSPTLISLIFASVPKLAIFVVICRIVLISSMSFFSFLWRPLFFFCGTLSLIIGCLGGLGEIKIKRLLAFSGISHVGFLCLSFSCSSIESLQAMFFYLLFYTLTVVFLWNYVLYLNPVKKKWLSLVDTVGLAQSNPIFGLLVCFMIFSLLGIPPFGGFFSKVFVFIALIDHLSFYAVFIAVITSVISAFYYLRIIKIIFFEKSQTWIFFNFLSKSQAIVLGLTSFIVLFFIFNPNIFYLITYKLALSLFL